MGVVIYLGIVFFLFISFTALISVLGWITSDKERKILKEKNAMQEQVIQKLCESLAKEKAWASIVNLETEDK